jgi:hypothetical protein
MRRNILEDSILHSHHRENLKSYIALTGWGLQQKRNVFPVRYERDFYIAEDGILHSYRRENLKSHVAYNSFWLDIFRPRLCRHQFFHSFW